MNYELMDTIHFNQVKNQEGGCIHDAPAFLKKTHKKYSRD